jgi:hypothetical protein
MIKTILYPGMKCVNKPGKQPNLEGFVKGHLVRDGSNPVGWPLPIVCICTWFKIFGMIK